MYQNTIQSEVESNPEFEIQQQIPIAQVDKFRFTIDPRTLSDSKIDSTSSTHGNLQFDENDENDENSQADIVIDPSILSNIHEYEVQETENEIIYTAYQSPILNDTQFLFKLIEDATLPDALKQSRNNKLQKQQQQQELNILHKTFHSVFFTDGGEAMEVLLFLGKCFLIIIPMHALWEFLSWHVKQSYAFLLVKKSIWYKLYGIGLLGMLYIEKGEEFKRYLMRKRIHWILPQLVRMYFVNKELEKLWETENL